MALSDNQNNNNNNNESGIYSEGIAPKIRVIIDLKLIHQQLKGLLFTAIEVFL
jgi:hypothetical protein